jgi:hypothetical protein
MGATIYEVPQKMTYQVVAFGIDGLVLGSDRKVFSRPPSAYGGDPYLQFDSQFKFVRSKDDAVICACAGSQEANRIANRIVKEARDGESLGDWQEFLWRVCREQGVTDSPELVVVRTVPLDVHWVVFGPDGHVSQISEKQCVGAKTSACFLATHFYEKRPVEQLKRFVLLVLDHAARELPNWIGNGYDLVTIKEGQQPHWELIESDGDYLRSIRTEFKLAVRSALYGQSQI